MKSNGIESKLDNFNLLLSAVRGTVGKVERDIVIVKKAVRALNVARHGQPQFALLQSREDENDLDNVCSLAEASDSGMIKIRKNFFATCDTESEGSWIVIQRRFDGSTEFFRSWEEYKEGLWDY